VTAASENRYYLFTIMAAIEIRKVTPRSYVGVRRTVKQDGIGPACADILPRVAEWLAAQGSSPAGPPIVVYHAFDARTGEYDAQPGFFVAAPVRGEGDIVGGETAGGEALTTLHVGPYTTLGETWEKVFAHARAIKRNVSKSSWEVYLNTPADVAPADLRTEIYVPLDPI
jgi:effector-binding domain-containing protein